MRLLHTNTDMYRTSRHIHGTDTDVETNTDTCEGTAQLAQLLAHPWGGGGQITLPQGRHPPGFYVAHHLLQQHQLGALAPLLRHLHLAAVGSTAWHGMA